MMFEFDDEKQRMGRLKSGYNLVIYGFDLGYYVGVVDNIEAAKKEIKEYCKEYDIISPIVFEIHAIPDHISLDDDMARRDDIDHVDYEGTDPMVSVYHSVGYIMTYYRSSYKRIDYLGSSEYGTR